MNVTTVQKKPCVARTRVVGRWLSLWTLQRVLYSPAPTTVECPRRPPPLLQVLQGVVPDPPGVSLLVSPLQLAARWPGGCDPTRLNSGGLAATPPLPPLCRPELFGVSRS